MASAIRFDSQLVKTVILLAAVGLLIWVISQSFAPDTTSRRVLAPAEAFELEPVTYGLDSFATEDEETFQDDEDMEGFAPDEEEMFEAEEYNDDEENFVIEEDGGVEGYYDDDEEMM